MSDDIKVTCPFCNGTLWVDPATGRVMHKEKSAKDITGDFDEFLAGASTHDRELAEKFKQAQLKEKHKLAELEEKFKWAKENPDKIKDDGGPRLI